ncbi:MAG TPA: insulinase family protein, partial [bacterium]
MAEVQKLIRFGVPDSELLKVKNKVKASKLFEKQNMDGQAKSLGFWELQGGYQLEDKFLKALDHVTSEDLQRVANLYLKPHRASVILYHPKSEKVNSNPSHWQSLLQKGLDSVNLQKKKPVPHKPKLQKFKLKNGSTLWVKERKNLPLTSIGVFLRGGFSEEKPDQYGITTLMSKCLMKGTLRKNHEEFSRDIESYAAHLDPSMEKDYLSLTLDVAKPSFEAAFDLMLETLLEPRFAPDEVAKEKKLQIASIERLKDDPGEYALMQSDVLTFAQTPYGHVSLGSVKTVSRLTAKDIQGWHKRYLSAFPLTWVAVGDFKAEE